MSTLSMWVLLVALVVGVASAIFPPRGLRKAGGMVLGGAVFSAIAGTALLLSVGHCPDGGDAGRQCPSTAGNLWSVISGGTGLVQAGLLVATLTRARQAITRRVLFSACVPLEATLFFITIFSVGAFLILAWWAGLGWLIVKAPPLRVGEPPASPN